MLLPDKILNTVLPAARQLYGHLVRSEHYSGLYTEMRGGVIFIQYVIIIIIVRRVHLCTFVSVFACVVYNTHLFNAVSMCVSDFPSLKRTF